MVKRVDWAERAKAILRMVNAGMDDPHIAKELDVVPSYVCAIRARFGIPAVKSGGPQPEKQPEPQADLPTYVDADGNTVKLCPTRYAVGVQPFTARPGGRGRRARE